MALNIPASKPEKKSTKSEKFLKEQKQSDNSIYIGDKPISNYVKSVSFKFSKGAPEIVIKARGKFISKAIDILEIIKRQMSNQGVKLIEIKTESEQMQKQNKTINVSVIEITLNKK